MLTGQEMQLGRGETIADTARVLSRYVDAIMIRTLDHETLLELARHATVPVINGLTRRSHPCQVMADVMTFEEHRGPIQRPHRGLDRRRQQRADLLDACRRALRLPAAGRDAAGAQAEEAAARLGQGSRGAAIRIGTDPEEAVKGADCVVTDTWVSMGDKDGKPPPQPAQALSGQCAADGARPSPTRSSCIACRPIAARRSPTR